MKVKWLYRIIFGCIVLVYSHQGLGQTSKKWQFGISAGIGVDQYQRKYKRLQPGPGALNSFSSSPSTEFTFFGEKPISDKFSILPKAYYSRQNVPVNTLCHCGYTANVILQKEVHHMMSAGIGIRSSIVKNTESRVYAGAIIHTDYFLGYTERRNDRTRTHWQSFGYNRIVPGIGGEIGIQWKRLHLSGEYKSNLIDSFAKKYEIANEPDMKRSIVRQGFNVKMSFVLSKKLII